MFKIKRQFKITDLAQPCDPMILSDCSQKYKGKDEANPACDRVIVSEKTYERLLKLASRDDQSSFEQILTLKTREKWLGPQGGSFSQETLERGLINYYESPEHAQGYDSELFEECASVVIAWCTAHRFMRRVEPIINNSRELYNTYSPDHKSVAGFTHRGDRRPYAVRVKCLRLAALDPDIYEPVIAGMRLKDGKYRNIFIDSFSNYFREARVFKRIFDWWTSFPSDMHYSDYECAKHIVVCKAAASYNADYKGMDWHMLPWAVKNTIKLFAYVTQMTTSELSYLLYHVEEMANAELIAGSSLFQGEHAWFSGLFPTHHIEGFQNFCNLLHTLTKLGWEVVPTPRKLKRNQAFIMVCGDDSTVLLGHKLSHSELETLTTLHEFFSWKLWGQVMEASKVDYSEDISTFCKKTFALRQDIKGYKHYTDQVQTPVHKFPLNKAIHALRYPENMPSFNDARGYAIWVCSIMDNSYGMRDYKSVIIYLYQQNRTLFASVDYSQVAVDQATVDYLNSDWFFRNYVSFSLNQSPTWNLLRFCSEQGL